MTESTYHLLIQTGPGAGQEYDLSGPALTIGRYPLAEIVIDDPDISYRHAVLTHSGETYRIADLGSEAGTYVNGRRIGAEPVPLSPGDIILLGPRVSAAFLANVERTVAHVDEEPAPVTTEFSNTAQPIVELSTEESSLITPSTTRSSEGESEYDPPAWEEESAVETPAIPPSRQPIHAGPLPAMPTPRKNRNGRIILIAAGCLVLLACCCSTTLFMYYIGGDWLLNQIGFLP